jgi:integrase
MVHLVEEYLADRRRLGFALEIEGQQLRSFGRFADSVGHAGPLTIDLAVRWATSSSRRRPRFPGRRLEVIRPFARYRAAVDGASAIPSRFLLGPPRRRPVHHIYTDGQLGALVLEAGNLRPAGGLRPKTYATLFGLLAACGLRVSEALRLGRTDVDLRRAVLTIRVTKFRKSRLVPLHSTTVAALRAYANERDAVVVRRAAASTFFVDPAGKPLPYSTVRNAFLRLSGSLGWSRLEPRPRIHDLRHTFACHRLRDWYAEERVDVGTKIAALATYLGHAHITDTYWYLTGSPDLLALAARRFEQATDLSPPAGEP